MASPLSLSSSMDARVHSFRRLKAENDLSQLTLPTGVVNKMMRILWMAGKICRLLHFNASAGDLGRVSVGVLSCSFLHLHVEIVEFVWINFLVFLWAF